MRLNRYLTEIRKPDLINFRSKSRFHEKEATQYKSQIENAINTIKKDCKPYIKVCDGTILWRGAKEVIQYMEMKKKVPRSDRRPKDTNENLHNAIDDTLKSMFGWRPRSSGVFVTPDYEEASGYGIDVFAIFPIGNFKFIWSPEIPDLYGHISILDYPATRNPAYYKAKLNISGKDVEKKLQEKLDEEQAEIRELCNKYTDKNFTQALKSKNEIMLGCKAYYIIEAGLLTHVWLGLFG